MTQAGGRFFGAGLLSSLLLFLFAASATAASELAVVGHPSLNISALSEQAVRDLYHGKTVQLWNGTRVEIVDLPPGHPVRNSFYITLIGRDPGQMRAYWAKRIFTGKGTPPETRPDEQTILRWVAAGAGRIAYVSADVVDDSVKVLLLHPGNGPTP
jgi:hypothetical protein